MPDARRVLVTTPTGNVGREVVRALLAAGQRVRAGVRDPGAVDGLPADVELVRLDLTDPATFAAAVEGARALFLLRPTQIARVGPTLNRLVDAAASAGVEHCVLLSVAGAERQPWLPHRRVEQHLERSSLTWTFLRPTNFAQNFTGPYAADVRAGRLLLPAGAGRVAFVDCADLGDVAALALAEPERHARRAYHLTGPEALGFADVAGLLTGALGRPVEYVPCSVPRYLRHLRGQGASPAFIAVLTMLHVGMRRSGTERVDDTLPALLGRPARGMDAFVRDHTDVWATRGRAA